MEHRYKQPPGFGFVLILLVILAIVGSVAGVVLNRIDRNEAIATATVTSKAAAVSVVQDSGKWLYRISSGDKEDIDPKPYATALVESDNQLDVKGYGEGSWGAGLTLNNYNGERSVMLMTRGHMVDCNSKICKLRVRFDDGKISEYKAIALSDVGLGVVAITKADDFIANLARSSRVKIETVYFKAGPKTYTFDVRGFDPKKLELAK